MTSPLITETHPPNSIAWGKQGEGSTLKQIQKAAWSAAFRSQLQEFDYEITEIEGALPDIRLYGINYAVPVGKCQQMRHRSRKRSKFLKP